MLVLGAATDYALLLVSRFREELRAHREPVRRDAGRLARLVRADRGQRRHRHPRPALPAVSDLASNKGLGPVGAIGIACALLVSLTLLPAILVLLGRAAFWPFRPRVRLARRPRSTASGRGSPRWSAAGPAPSGSSPRWCCWPASRRPDPAGGRRHPADRGVHRPPDSVVGAGAHSARTSPAAPAARPRSSPSGPADGRRRGRAAVAGVDRSAVRREPADRPAAPAGAEGRRRAGADRRDADRRRPTAEAASETRRAAARPRCTRSPGADAKVGGFTAINHDVQHTSQRDRNVIIPLVLRGHLPDPDAAAALADRAAAAHRDRGAVLPGDARHVRVVFNDVLRLPRRGPVVPAVRVRVPGRARHRLQHLPDDPGPGGGRQARPPRGHAARAGGDRRRHHLGRRGARGDVRGAGGAAAGVPGPDRVRVAFGVLLDTLLVRSLLVPALTVDIGRFVWWPGRLWRSSR